MPDDQLFDDDDLFGEDEPQGQGGEDDEVAERPMLRRRKSSGEQETGKAAGKPSSRQQEADEESLAYRWKSRLHSRSVRPGEEDTLRSPFVLGLGGGALVLLLAAATFYFIIGRQAAQQQYDAAIAQLSQGKYAQAIRIFEDFLKDYPRHDLTQDARINLGKARIEQQIAGATPAWKAGVEKLQSFIERNRDRPNFNELHEDVRDYAQQIALGAAQDAEVSKQRELLEISEIGRRLLVRYSPSEEQPVKQLEEIDAAYRQAKAAIRKHETFEQAVTEMQAALDNNEPMAALAARTDLLDRYADFREDPKLGRLLEQILETEKKRITREDVEREAANGKPRQPSLRPLSLMVHTRSRTDAQSAGRRVIALAKDCCYGIDTITGEPVWRRVIGRDTPFFPVPVSTSVAGLVVYDTKNNDLLLLNRQNGEVVWRQHIGEELAGGPLIHQGQIYLPTLGKQLNQINLEDGRMSTLLSFSQKVLGPPTLIADGNHCVVAGDSAVLYTLSLRPLEVQTVSFLGHQPGSIQAPLLKMGQLLLVAENDRMNSCRLQVLDCRSPRDPLSTIAETRLEGQVRDVPILRGKELFVPHTPTRITAFTVSDDPDQRPLTKMAGLELTDIPAGPMHLAAGPDGQLWLAADALRKMRLKTDSIELQPQKAAVGLSSQPLQMIGEDIFTGRQLPYSQAVLFSQADRDEMVGHWRTVLGGALLACSRLESGDGAVCLNEAGNIFRVTAQEIRQGGFVTEAAETLELPPSLEKPLQANRLADGRLAVHAGRPKPRLWIINRLGQVQREYELDAPLQTDPVLLEAGIVAPLPGRLKLLGSSREVEDFVAPVSQEGQSASRWQQLARLDAGGFVALDSRGRLSRIQYRQAPTPHLGEVSSREFDAPIDVELAVHGNRIGLADADGRLQIVQASNLQSVAETHLDAPASGPVWIVDEKLYVEAGRDRLLCFTFEPSLQQQWSLPLEGSPLAGSPRNHQKAVVVAQQNGRIRSVNPDDGSVIAGLRLPQALNRGPQKVGDLLVAASIDGSLYALGSRLSRKD